MNYKSHVIKDGKDEINDAPKIKITKYRIPFEPK